MKFSHTTRCPSGQNSDGFGPVPLQKEVVGDFCCIKFGGNYRWLQNGYISNSKTLKSVSVSASVAVINSHTIKVGICNPEKRQITDMVTDLP